MLCGLTGTSRAAEVRAPTVEASRIVAVAQAVVPVAVQVVAARPDGYVATDPLILDLTIARSFALPVTPERRRE